MLEPVWLEQLWLEQLWPGQPWLEQPWLEQPSEWLQFHRLKESCSPPLTKQRKQTIFGDSYFLLL
jgi:hypothetical protein